MWKLIVLVKHVVHAEGRVAFWLRLPAQHRVVLIQVAIECVVSFVNTVVVRVVDFTGHIRDLTVVLVFIVELPE